MYKCMEGVSMLQAPVQTQGQFTFHPALGGQIASPDHSTGAQGILCTVIWGQLAHICSIMLRNCGSNLRGERWLS